MIRAGSREGDRFKTALEASLGIEIELDLTVGWEYRQFKFPRSKKKRIRKKWSKNPRYCKIVDTGDVLVKGRKVIMGRHTLHNLMVEVLNKRTNQWLERLQK